MRAASILLALGILTLGLAPAQGQESVSRWQPVRSGWIWDPSEAGGLRRISSATGSFQLAAGDYFLAPAGGDGQWRIQTSGADFDAYSVEVGSPRIARLPRRHVPPSGTPLVAIEMPKANTALGEWRLELPAEAAAEWIAIRSVASPTWRFSLQQRVTHRSADEWERLEEKIRAAADPSLPWPTVDRRTAEGLPGHEVESFFRRQAEALPWGPEEDDADARSVRIAHFLLTSGLARPLSATHYDRRPWRIPGSRKLDDEVRVDSSLEQEVKGPAILRVRARTEWPSTPGEPGATRPILLRARVGERVESHDLFSGVDLERTARLWEENPDLAQQRAFLSLPREIRIAVPPGVHRIRLDFGPDTWIAAEEAHRRPRWEERRAESYLPESGAPEVHVLTARLRGNVERALALLDRLPRATSWSDRMTLELNASAERFTSEKERTTQGLSTLERTSWMRAAWRIGHLDRAIFHAERLLLDPHALPQDVSEALAIRSFSGVTGGDRAWYWSGRREDSADLRRQLDGRRPGFGSWRALPTSRRTSLRRFLLPVDAGGEEANEVLPAELRAAWIRARSGVGRGPWRRARAEDFTASTPERGSLEVLPARSESTQPLIELRNGGRILARVRFADGITPVPLAWDGADPGIPVVADVESPTEEFLWRSDVVDCTAVPPASLRGTPASAFPWVFPETLSEVVEGSSVEFIASDSGAGGLARVLVAVSHDTTGDRAGGLDAPFRVHVGGILLPSRRVLWIPDPERGRPSPRSEILVAASHVLIPAGATTVAVDVSARRAAVGVAELRSAGVSIANACRLAEFRHGAAGGTAEESATWPSLRAGRPLSPRDLGVIRETTRRLAEGDFSALWPRAQALVRAGDPARARDDLLTLEEQLRWGVPGDDLRLRAWLALGALALDGGDLREARRVYVRALLLGNHTEALVGLALHALSRDDARTARALLARARGRPSFGALDAARWAEAELGIEPLRTPRDPYYRTLHDLARARRAAAVDRTSRYWQAWQHRLEAERELWEERGELARSERWLVWTDQLRHLAKRSSPSVPPGWLDPLAAEEEIEPGRAISAPAPRRLHGRFSRPLVWPMESEEEVSLLLAGPRTYSIIWRPLHPPEGGRAAATRLLFLEENRVRTRSTSVGTVARNLRLEHPSRLPAAGLPGARDVWRVLVDRPGKATVRLERGAGLLQIRRLAARAHGVWGPRLDPPSPTPTARFPRSPWSPDPLRDLRDDVDRRRRALERWWSANPGPWEEDTGGPSREALESLAEDALYLAVTHPESVRGGDILLALAIWENVPSTAHGRRHERQARSWTRWRTVDLAGGDDFHWLELRPEDARSEAEVITEALFPPFPDGGDSTLMSSDRVLRWHHRSAREEALVLEAQTETDPRDPPRSSWIRISLDGEVWSRHPLPAGEITRIPLPAVRDGVFRMELSSTSGLGDGVRARIRLRHADTDKVLPAAPSRNRFWAGGATFTAALRGPTIYRIQRWHRARKTTTAEGEPRTLGPPEVQEGFAVASGVQTIGVASDVGESVRVQVRTFDPDSHRRTVEELPWESVRGFDPPEPPALLPDLLFEGLSLDVREEALRLSFESYVRPIVRENQDDRPLDEEEDRDELRVGARVHAGGWPFFGRLTFEQIWPESQPRVNSGELRLHHYLEGPLPLDTRLIARGWSQDIDGSDESAWELRARLQHVARLRPRLESRESIEWGTWDSSLDAESFAISEDDVYRSLFNDYRDTHRDWLTVRWALRYHPYQNLWIEPYTLVRTNDDYEVLDPDRWIGGLHGRAHLHPWTVGLGYRWIERFSDEDRDKDFSEDLIHGLVAYDRWLRSHRGLSLEARGEYSFTNDAWEIFFGAIYRFGPGTDPDSSSIDPELRRFPREQDSRYPWGRP